MNPESGAALGDLATREMADAYLERVEYGGPTIEQILKDPSRLTSPQHALSMITEVLITLGTYPTYKSKATHLLQSFRSTIQLAGPLESEFAYRQELFQMMELAACIRPLKSVNVPLPRHVLHRSSDFHLQMIFDHVNEVLSEYEGCGPIFDPPSYEWPHLSASLNVVLERANSHVVQACQALINVKLTFHEPLLYASWHSFAIALCQKAMQGSYRNVDAHLVWLLIKSYAPEYPTEGLPAGVRAEHELAVALFQVARDCFDPAVRSPVGSQ